MLFLNFLVQVLLSILVNVDNNLRLLGNFLKLSSNKELPDLRLDHVLLRIKDHMIDSSQKSLSAVRVELHLVFPLHVLWIIFTWL